MNSLYQACLIYLFGYILLALVMGYFVKVDIMRTVNEIFRGLSYAAGVAFALMVLSLLLRNP